MHNVRLASRLFSIAKVYSGVLSQREKALYGNAILVYHGVVDRVNNSPLDTYFIDYKTFEKQIVFIRSKYEIVPLSSIVNAFFSGGDVSSRLIAITFDDALVSQIDLAGDLLSKYSIPWAISIPVGLVGSERSLWSYELPLIVFRCWNRDSIPVPYSCDDGYLPARSGKDKLVAFSKIRNYLQCRSGAEILSYVDRLIEYIGVDNYIEALTGYKRFNIASWEQIHTLYCNGVEILSHGWHHLPFNNSLSHDEIVKEICASRKEIKRRLQFSPSCFVYPHGCFHENAQSVLELAGYSCALTTDPSWISRCDNRFKVPRIDCEYPLSILRNHIIESSKRSNTNNSN